MKIEIINITSSSIITDIGPKFLSEWIYSKRLKKLAKDLRYLITASIKYGAEFEELVYIISHFIEDNPHYKFYITPHYSSVFLDRIFPIVAHDNKFSISIQASEDFGVIQIEIEAKEVSNKYRRENNEPK